MTASISQANRPGRLDASNPKWVPGYRKHSVSSKHSYAFVKINGREHYLGKNDSEESRAQYRRIIAEWEASGRSPTFGVLGHRSTIKLFADAYLRHCSTYYGDGANSELHRSGRVLRTLCDLYGTAVPEDFGPQQLKAVRFTLISEGLARRNINALIKRVVRMFRWGVSEGLIAASTAEALSMVPGLQRGRCTARETEPIRPVATADVDATLPHLSQVVADMVRLQLLTGCRPSELCQLRPCDVDQADDVWAYRPQRHKTMYLGRERVIVIGPNAQEVLRPYLARDPAAACFSPREAVQWQHRQICKNTTRTTPVYPCELRSREKRKLARRNQPGRKVADAYDARAYCHAIKYACQEAGIAPWSPNQLRHSAATNIRRRFGLEAAQVVLGHAQANITQIDAERDYALAASVAKQVG